jgi:hypothetical protein
MKLLPVIFFVLLVSCNSTDSKKTEKGESVKPSFNVHIPLK